MWSAHCALTPTTYKVLCTKRNYGPSLRRPLHTLCFVCGVYCIFVSNDMIFHGEPLPACGHWRCFVRVGINRIYSASSAHIVPRITQQAQERLMYTVCHRVTESNVHRKIFGSWTRMCCSICVRDNQLSNYLVRKISDGWDEEDWLGT